MQNSLTLAHIQTVVEDYPRFTEHLGRALRADELDDVYQMAIHGESDATIVYLLHALPAVGRSYMGARAILPACVPGTTVEDLVRAEQRTA